MKNPLKPFYVNFATEPYRVPKVYFDHEIETGELIELMPQWKIASVPFSAIFHKDRYQPKHLRSCIDFM